MSAMPEYAMTYVIVWPDAAGPGLHVVKVGRAWKSHRVEMMTRSGGQVVILARGTDASWEREALGELGAWFPRAFRTPTEAEGLLFMGRGFTECFVVDDGHLPLAVDLIFEGFARGNEQGENPAGPAHALDGRGLVEGAVVHGQVDGDVPVGAGGRRGSGGVAAGPDRGVSVPGGSGGDPVGGGDVDAAPRRVGVPDDLHARRGDLVPAGETPGDATPDPVGASRPACSGILRKFHGYGGSGRAGVGAGACRGGGPGEPVGRVGGGAGAGGPSGTSSAVGCPTDRMSGPPAQPVRPRLRRLRHGTAKTRSVAHRTQIRQTGRTVRKVDVR